MVETLLEEAFEKAGYQCGKTSINARADFLAHLLTEDFKYTISSKSMERYYNQKSTPKLEVLNGLAEFIGYMDYSDYLKNRNPEACDKTSTTEVTRRKDLMTEPRRIRKEKYLLLLLVFCALGLGSYYGFMKEGNDCIRWSGDCYQAVQCSGDPLDKPFSLSLMENLRKIEVTDTTQFFKNGNPRIWYSKTRGELEFFTSPGLHPVSGKTLKPISRYMINKYVNTNP